MRGDEVTSRVAREQGATRDVAAEIDELAAYCRKLATPIPGSVCGDPTFSTFADLFGIIAGLTRVATDQERRIVVLEPCPKRGGEPHIWDAATGRTCHACGVTK